MKLESPYYIFVNSLRRRLFYVWRNIRALDFRSWEHINVVLLLRGCYALFVLITFISSLNAQSSGEFTPLAMAPGAPAGSVALSEAERINPYNGNFSFSLPVLQIAGRGDLQVPLSINIEQHWRALVFQGYGAFAVPEESESPTSIVYGGKKILNFNPGNLIVRRSGNDATPCSGLPFPYNMTYQKTLTRLTFTGPDGTEIELVDKLWSGGPLERQACTQGTISRGRIFESTDGSSTIFISDNEILESAFVAYGIDSGPGQGTGYLKLKNGTTYRIENGLIVWMVDRNGNRMEFLYSHFPNTFLPYRVSTIKDSLGRTVSIEYDVADAAPYGLCDRIIFSGFGGNQKIIRISKADISTALRSDSPRLTYIEMWGGPTGQSVYYNHLVPIAVWLPDGVRKYNFFYNSYMELARIELPSGGAHEYDYAPGFVNGTNGGMICGYSPKIYRRLIERRTYSDGASLESRFTYSRPEQISSGSCPTMPAAASSIGFVEVEHFESGGNRINAQKHFYHGVASKSFYQNPVASPAWIDGREYKTELLNGAGAVLSRNEQTWQNAAPTWWAGNSTDAPANNPHLVETTTTLMDTGQVSKRSSLNPNSPNDDGYDAFHNQTDLYEYDYGNGAPGPLLRHSHTDYLTSQNGIDYTDPTINIKNLPVTKWVKGYDSNGQELPNYASYQVMVYDDPGVPLILYPGETVSGWVAPSSPARGNLNKLRTWLDTDGSFIEIKSQYDQLGNRVKTWDAKGNETTVDYSDRFGTPDGEARSNAPPLTLNGEKTYALPTKTTNGFGWSGYTQYDYFSGSSVNSENENGIIGKSVYNDPLGRLTQSVLAVGTAKEIQSTTLYDDSSRRVLNTSDHNMLGDNLIKTESFYDGLGRTVEVRDYEADGNYIVTKSQPVFTHQDPQSMTWYAATRKSLPYRPAAGDTPQWTINVMDALGRGIKVISSDGTSVITAFTGNSTVVTDQSGRLRRLLVDSLGRLKRVDEPNDQGALDVGGAPILPTSYNYDPSGNLTNVAHGVQGRTFAYDSVSRLVQATNPESGTTSYTYDSNGNLKTKRDANGFKVIYDYDQLDRVIRRCYRIIGSSTLGSTTCANNSESPDANTPDVTFDYDDANIAFAKGSLARVANSNSVTRYTSFDEFGQVLTSQQLSTPEQLSGAQEPYTSSYVYNLAGKLVEQVYPSGRSVKNILDNTGRLARTSSRKDPTQGYFDYAEHFSYTATGAVKSVRLGNGRWESTQFNSRLQPTQIALGTVQNGTDKLRLDYEYGTLNPGTGQTIAGTNNGNVSKQTITVPTVGINPGFVATQYYAYDSLNRIQIATENVTPQGQSAQLSWRQQFIYDRYGNRTFDIEETTFPDLQSGVPKVVNPEVSAAKNRYKQDQDNDGVDDYIYDDGGNLGRDAEGNRFKYNAENKQVEFYSLGNSSSVPTAKYYYDGSDKRVRKVVGDEVTIYVYDIGERLVAEYTSNIQVNDRVQYTTADHLGSPRIITDGNGAMISRRDFMPFGEEISTLGGRTTALNYNADEVTQRFSGKERDTETGLDYFGGRYYSSRFGRFMNPDKPFLDQDEFYPQSWNIYMYARNNPLRYIDLSGFEIIYASPELEAISNALRASSATYDAALKGYEGKDAPNLLVQFGDAGFDADGKTKATGMATPSIQQAKPAGEHWGSVKDADGNVIPDKHIITVNPAVPAKVISATITIDNSLKGNTSEIEGALGHEVGHVDDARKNPDTFLANSQQTAAEKGKTPHDKRPNEIVANAFEKTVLAEKQATQKAQEQKQKEEKKREKDEKKRQKREKTQMERFLEGGHGPH